MANNASKFFQITPPLDCSTDQDGELQRFIGQLVFDFMDYARLHSLDDSTVHSRAISIVSHEQQERFFVALFISAHMAIADVQQLPYEQRVQP